MGWGTSRRKRTLRYYRLFTVLIISWFPATAGAQELSPRDIMGCYDLHFGKWEPELTRRFDTLRHLPPPRIEFDTAFVGLGNSGSRSRIVRPAPGSKASRHRFSGWEVVGDSIRVGWSTGYLGLRMVLAPAGEQLVGHAQTFSDAYREGDRDFRSEVRAQPVQCSMSPTHPDSVSQFVPRSVSLSSGYELELGQPLPDSGLAREWASERSLSVRGTATGLFSGVEEIRAELSRSGVVQEIRLTFPEGTDVEALKRRLEEAIRPVPPAERENAVIRAGWEDSITSLVLATHSGRVEVLIWDPRLI
jgi:hypothetical protein